MVEECCYTCKYESVLWNDVPCNECNMNSYKKDILSKWEPNLDNDKKKKGDGLE